MAKSNTYARIIAALFEERFKKGAKSFAFERKDLVQVAKNLNVAPPKNLGDILYSVRYRQGMPKIVLKNTPKGYEWIIHPAGKSKYRFQLYREISFNPNKSLAVTRIPDSTPGIVSKYALSDEQALLAIIRYNRLIDIFSGVACYSLQNHLRTSVKDFGQVETDEIYAGIDKRGAQFVFPVQAKGGRDRLNIVQILQDFALCAEKFPALICRPVTAQFMTCDTLALFEIEQDRDAIAISSERHYQLVAPNDLSDDEIRKYARRSLS